jgi:HK97 family phage major capsid protein
MKFKSIQEAFNHYMNSSIADIEKRAKEIKQIVDTDPNADIASLNIELEGLKQAKENIEQRSQKPAQQFNPITGASFEPRASYDATDGDVFASAEYRSAFFKNLLGHQLNAHEEAAFKRAMAIAEKRTSEFNTVSNAAAVLPTTTLNEVIKKARTMGGLISVCRSFNLPTKIAVPVGTPATKAEWHIEGQAVESEEATVATVSFNGYEILKVFSISAAAKRMSIAAFESYIIDELNACVMECIADALVNGTGSGQGTGLESITWTATGNNKNAVEYEAGEIPTYADFVAAMALLKRGYSQGAKWAMNNATLYTHVYGVMDSNDRPIFIADPKNESIGYILGREVVIDDNIADGDIYLGNFNYMGYNLAEGIVIEVSRESSFRSGLIDYRALAIADCKPIVTEAFVKLQEAEA